MECELFLFIVAAAAISEFLSSSLFIYIYIYIGIISVYGIRKRKTGKKKKIWSLSREVSTLLHNDDSFFFSLLAMKAMCLLFFFFVWKLMMRVVAWAILSTLLKPTFLFLRDFRCAHGEGDEYARFSS